MIGDYPTRGWKFRAFIALVVVIILIVLLATGRV